MNSASKSLRLFYALWPDDAVRAKLVTLQSHVNGRKVMASNLHLTLAFLGQQSSDLVPTLQRAMDDLPLEAMHLSIDTLGYFKKPQVAWAGPSLPPPSLLDLHRLLQKSLIQLRVPLKINEGFKPHVTLARDAVAPVATSLPAVEWHVKCLALVASVSTTDGVTYVPLREWTLT